MASNAKLGRDLAEFHRYNKPMITKIISSENEMHELAQELGRHANAGDIFLLNGPLGAGKSVFARAFIQSICGNETEVPSPTFTLVQTYDSEKAAIWHFDLYRLQSPEEIFEIGWENAITDGICLVEWPERLGMYAPQQAKTIIIEVIAPQTRKITIHAD